MSVTLMALVWPMDLPTTDKVVLLALADAANDDGVTWIPVRTRRPAEERKLDLLKKCSLSERAVQGAIKRLEAEGYIERVERPGKGVIYTVKPPQQMRPAQNAPPQETTRTPAADAGKPSVTINTEAKAPVDCVIEVWNEEAEKHGFHKVRVLDNSRKQMLRLRIKTFGLETMLEAVRRVGRTPFLCGKEGDGRRADINIILQPKTLARVLEGFYGTAEEQRRMSPAETHAWYVQNAAFCRRMNREEDAQRCEAHARALEEEYPELERPPDKVVEIIAGVSAGLKAA